MAPAIDGLLWLSDLMYCGHAGVHHRLNGKSVNVIFEDPATAKRALLHVGRPVPLEEVRLQDEASKGEEDAENAEAKQPESESGQTDASAMAGSEHQSASLESPAEETNSTVCRHHCDMWYTTASS